MRERVSQVTLIKSKWNECWPRWWMQQVCKHRLERKRPVSDEFCRVLFCSSFTSSPNIRCPPFTWADKQISIPPWKHCHSNPISPCFLYPLLSFSLWPDSECLTMGWGGVFPHQMNQFFICAGCEAHINEGEMTRRYTREKKEVKEKRVQDTWLTWKHGKGQI